MYHLGFGIGLILIMVIGLGVFAIFNVESGHEYLLLVGFLGIISFGYSIFSQTKYIENPCVCGHKDYYHEWDITRKACDQCGCQKFKERILPKLDESEFMLFEEWKRK